MPYTAPGHQNGPRYIETSISGACYFKSKSFDWNIYDAPTGNLIDTIHYCMNIGTKDNCPKTNYIVGDGDAGFFAWNSPRIKVAFAFPGAQGWYDVYVTN